jgi:hypothetical protein
MNYNLIQDIELDGVNTNDFPDFSDAFIVAGVYDNKPMTEEQIEELIEDRNFVYECIENHSF